MNIENKKRNLVMLSMITSVLIATTMPVLGYDHDNPATYTVQYVIPSDTSFSVLTCGSQQNMWFNATNGSSKSVVAYCPTPNTAWANITNTGNLNLNFSTNLTATNPSWVVLNIGSAQSMSDQITVTNTATSPAGWLNVPPAPSPGNTVQLYAVASFTNAPQGTTPMTLRINS